VRCEMAGHGDSFVIGLRARSDLLVMQALLTVDVGRRGRPGQMAGFGVARGPGASSAEWPSR
jgi:hypothetical protein